MISYHPDTLDLPADTGLWDTAAVEVEDTGVAAFRDTGEEPQSSEPEPEPKVACVSGASMVWSPYEPTRGGRRHRRADC